MIYKLLSATPSPYARKVRIALIEKDIPFELLTEVPWNADATTGRYNPLEKLPVLILHDGETVPLATGTRQQVTEGVKTLHSRPLLSSVRERFGLSQGQTLFELDEMGNVAIQIDPNGDATEYVYDSAGGNLGRNDASGQRLLPFDIQPHRPNGLAYQLPSSAEGCSQRGQG